MNSPTAPLPLLPLSGFAGRSDRTRESGVLWSLAARRRLDECPQELVAELQRSGSPALRALLVERFAPLVASAVRGLQGGNRLLDRDDLLSIGRIGLLDALERFDPAQGVAFSSFAFWRIRCTIIDELRRLDPAPRRTRARIGVLRRVRDGLEAVDGRRPTPDEIAREAGLSRTELHQVAIEEASTGTPRSLDEQVFGGEVEHGSASTLADRIVDESAIDPSELVSEPALRDLVASARARLPERERLALFLRFEEGRELAEIGALLGVSDSRVSQLLARALGLLAAPIAGSTGAGVGAGVGGGRISAPTGIAVAAVIPFAGPRRPGGDARRSPGTDRRRSAPTLLSCAS